jgi:hypothetical protein
MLFALQVEVVLLIVFFLAQAASNNAIQTTYRDSAEVIAFSSAKRSMHFRNSVRGTGLLCESAHTEALVALFTSKCTDIALSHKLQYCRLR